MLMWHRQHMCVDRSVTCRLRSETCALCKVLSGAIHRQIRSCVSALEVVFAVSHKSVGMPLAAALTSLICSVGLALRVTLVGCRCWMECTEKSDALHDAPKKLVKVGRPHRLSPGNYRIPVAESTAIIVYVRYMCYRPIMCEP